MTSHVKSIGIRQSSTAKPFSILAVFRNVGSTFRQRRALGQLDAVALHDIGLTRQQAVKEAKRAIWDVPSNWRR